MAPCMYYLLHLWDVCRRVDKLAPLMYRSLHSVACVNCWPLVHWNRVQWHQMALPHRRSCTIPCTVWHMSNVGTVIECSGIRWHCLIDSGTFCVLLRKCYLQCGVCRLLANDAPESSSIMFHCLIEGGSFHALLQIKLSIYQLLGLC